MDQPDTSGHTPGAIGPAIVVALITGTLIAGALSYTMKHHDVAHAQAARHASEQIALAVGQQFAESSGDIIGSDLFRLQHTLEKGFPGTTLVSAMLIDQDNMVVASKIQSSIGHQMKDASWQPMRDQDKEIVSHAVAQNGQETLIVVEPIKEKGTTVAWAYFVFALPAVKQLVMAPADRWTETARLVGPISALVFIAVWWLLRSSTISIKKAIAQALAEAQEGKPVGSATARLKKAS
jgi:hypothetical protein